MVAHLPSVDTLKSKDEGRLRAEVELIRLRSQLAVVRTVADQVDQVARPHDADGLRGQLVEELARLGCQLLAAAASLTEPTPSDDSGVFARRGPSFGSAD